MRRVVQIVTRPPDPLTHDLLQAERDCPNTQVELLDLTKDNPDYRRLLELVFAADSVQVF